MAAESLNLQSVTIGAVVLAAGQSRRMGSPKMVLPWGNTTVLGRVIDVLDGEGVDEIVVVTGGSRQEVEAILEDLPARSVFNPHYANDEMSYSLQIGLKELSSKVHAALVVLGDQPQIEAGTVRAVIDAYRHQRALLVVPSYQQRRGHPWLLDRKVWSWVWKLQPPQTLRDLLNAQQKDIHYLALDRPTILRDLDTPADYERDRPLDPSNPE